MELFQGLGLGLIGHPRKLLDALFIGGNQVANQFIHCCFRSWREVFLDIDLSYRFAEAALNQSHCTLPARTVHRLSGELGSIEAKSLIHKTGR